MTARLLVLAFVLAACWRDSSARPQPPDPAPAPAPAPARRPAPRPLSEAERAIEMMERFTDQMCDCQDSACAQSVSDEMTRWSQDQARQRTEPPKLSDEEMKRAVAIGERMGECLMRAMGSSSSSPSGSGSPPLGTP